MKFRWNIAPSEPLLAGEIARKLGITELLAQCLLNRGHSVPDRINHFLQPRLKHLADPFLLPDMGLAVDRLFRAREAKESVVIFGDYDVDGVTSTALLLEVLNRLGWRSEYYLPSRMDEGYGLSQEAADNCLRKFPGFVAAGGGLWFHRRRLHSLPQATRNRRDRAGPSPGRARSFRPRWPW